MAKKFGKLALFTVVATVAGAAAYHYLQKKNDEDFDEDFDVPVTLDEEDDACEEAPAEEAPIEETPVEEASTEETTAEEASNEDFTPLAESVTDAAFEAASEVPEKVEEFFS